MGVKQAAGTNISHANCRCVESRAPQLPGSGYLGLEGRERRLTRSILYSSFALLLSLPTL
jgi:hypothetical protein